MGKSFMLSLSVTFVLVGLLYVFMKQKLSNNDKRINSLYGVVQQLAGEIQIMKTPYGAGLGAPSGPPQATAEAPNPTADGAPTSIDVSDDSGSDSGSDSDSDSDSDSHGEADSQETGGDEEHGAGMEATAKGGDCCTLDGKCSTPDGSCPAPGDSAEPEVQEIDVLNVQDLIQQFDTVRDEGAVELQVEELSADVTDSDIRTHDISLDITSLDTQKVGSSKVVEVNLDEDLSKLSVKELKSRVQGLHGPPLKTKKALIEYIQSSE